QPDIGHAGPVEAQSPKVMKGRQVLHSRIRDEAASKVQGLQLLGIEPAFCNNGAKAAGGESYDSRPPTPAPGRRTCTLAGLPRWPSARAPPPPAPAYLRWVAPDGFAVTDLDGSWVCVAKDDQDRPTHVVAGLVTTSGDHRYPKLPRAFFADPLEVPLDP